MPDVQLSFREGNDSHTGSLENASAGLQERCGRQAFGEESA